MKAQIVSIGNELLIGDTVNTNATWLGQTLTEFGVELEYVHTIGDDYSLIQDAVLGGLKYSDLVITTGGLGPTHDDVTKKAVADLFDLSLKEHKPTLKYIQEMFKKRELNFSNSNYEQALVPEKAEVLFNKQGTAPGIWLTRDAKNVVMLPGVPFEMKELMHQQVLPRIEKLFNGYAKRYTRHILTAGVGESSLNDEIIGSLDTSPKVSIAYLPSPAGTKIRMTGKGKKGREHLDEVAEAIHEKASEYIIGEGKDCSLEKVVGQILRTRHKTLGCAESCTGGRLVDSITNISGSSAYFMGGLVTYSNQAKVDLLDVTRQNLDQYGAVSKQVALEMCRGAARRFKTDIGISTTGIAGPGGGSEEKPVGTVWIGYWSEHRHFALKALFTNDRIINKKRTVAVALDTIRRSLQQIDSMPYGLKPHSA